MLHSFWPLSPYRVFVFGLFGPFKFGHLDLFRISDFVLRIWQRLRRMLIEEA
jgi:hypothetical protein